MRSEKNPVFLARRAYFRRRVTDAARLLPVLGAGLFLLPLLWKGSEARAQIGTVEVMFYVFLCWLALVGLAFFVAARMSDRGDALPEMQPPDVSVASLKRPLKRSGEHSGEHSGRGQ